MKPRNFFAAILVVSAYTVVESRKYHDVMWNSRFFDGIYRESTLNVHLGDQLTIICPKAYHEGFHYDFAKLYWVSESGYSNCFLHQPKLIAVCGTPNETAVIKMTFRRTNPIPGGMEFKVGETYYLISTSSGEADEIDQNVGGLCHKYQMKLAISVDGPEETKNWAPKVFPRKHDLDQLEYVVHDHLPYMSTTKSNPVNLVMLLCTVIFFINRIHI